MIISYLTVSPQEETMSHLEMGKYIKYKAMEIH